MASPRGGWLRSLALFLVLGAAALTGLEAWADRWSWPVDPAWYRLEERDGEVVFGCQSFAPVVFPARPGARRILLVGGSTSFGFPERPTGSDPVRRARHGLAGALQAGLGDGFDLVNLGVNGGSSEDTLRIVRRALDWGAEAMVVYDGHNEHLGVPGRFSAPLWRFALYRRFAVLLPRAEGAPGWVGAPAYGDARHLAAVLARFEANLRAIVTLGTAAGMRVVLSTQASNLTDFDPSWSTSGDAAALGRLRGLTDAEVEAAYAADPGSADVAFEAGRRRRAAGGDARPAFQAALDADGMPFRATTELNGIIRRVARGATLVDAEAGVSPSDDAFYDWVHPRPVTSETIAALILDGLRVAGVARHPGIEDEPEVALRTAVSWVQWACVRRHDPARRAARARSWAARALALRPDFPEAEAIDRVAQAIGEGSTAEVDPAIGARLARIHPCVAEVIRP